MSKRLLAWQWMKQQECFTTTEVANAVEMDLEQCRTTIKKLEAQGYLRHIGGPGVPGRAKRYSLNPDAVTEPRLGKGAVKGERISRQGKTGQQLIWNTLRINPIVTVSTIEAVTKCSGKSIYLYLRNLEKAGYLRTHKVDTRLANCEISGHETIWKLRPQVSGVPGETGPKAPILRRGVGMYDQNRNTLYPFKGSSQ